MYVCMFVGVCAHSMLVMYIGMRLRMYVYKRLVCCACGVYILRDEREEVATGKIVSNNNTCKRTKA